MVKYELLDHTADTGIRVFGQDFRDLFVNAASAMFDIIAKPKDAEKSLKAKGCKIDLHAKNIEELFIRWLSELVSLSDLHHVIFTDFQIDDICATKLKGAAQSLGQEHFIGKTEIKAVTYHGLKIIQNTQGYTAEVIFDV